MRRGVRARRVVRRFELWSVAKVAFLFHLFCGFFSLLVVIGLWFAADRLGVLTKVESFLGDLLGTKNFQLFGDKLLRAAAGTTVALVLLATVGTVFMAFIYNMLSGIFGGVVVSVLHERAPVAPGNDGPQAIPAPRRGRRRRRRRFRRAKRATAPRPGAGPTEPVVSGSDTSETGSPPDTNWYESGPGGGTAEPEAVSGADPNGDWIAASSDPTGSWMAPGGR